MNYEKIRELGRGGFGTVYLARDASGDRIVVKEIDLSQMDAEAQKVILHGEVDVFKYIKSKTIETDSPYLIKYIRHQRHMDVLVIIMEFHEDQISELYVRSSRDKNRQKRLIVNVFKQVVRGIHALHTCGVLHRDIKPNNLLYDSATQKIKIADFGNACIRWNRSSPSRGRFTEVLETDNCNNCVGTPGDFDPAEILKGSACTINGKASDMYSIGATFYELFFGVMYQQKTSILRQDFTNYFKALYSDLGRQIAEELGAERDSEIREFLQTIHDLLNPFSVDERPTAEQILGIEFKTKTKTLATPVKEAKDVKEVKDVKRRSPPLPESDTLQAEFELLDMDSNGSNKANERENKTTFVQSVIEGQLLQYGDMTPPQVKKLQRHVELWYDRH